MATQIFCRRTFPKSLTLSSFFSRSLSTSTPTASPLRTLAALRHHHLFLSSPSMRTFSTRATTSSLNDPSPNWSNRPPKETILLDGCDFEHWLIVMEKPEGDPTRDEIIDSYIKTLAKVVGSEEEARMKIYSVSTRHYYAFGALVSEEVSYKIKELERVRWVLPDSYLNVKEKDYGGEPFINGQAVPYDPKYHEEWVRNNARANERNRRNDRPRNADRSRNFERRRENVVNRDMQDRPPMPNQGSMGVASNMGGAPPNNMGGAPPNNAVGYPPHNEGGYPPHNAGGYPPHNTGGFPPQNAGRYPPQNAGGYAPQNAAGGYPPNMGQVSSNMGEAPPQSGYGGMPTNNPMGGMPQNNYAGMTHNNTGGMPPNQNMGGFQPNAGWSSTAPSRDH